MSKSLKVPSMPHSNRSHLFRRVAGRSKSLVPMLLAALALFLAVPASGAQSFATPDVSSPAALQRAMTKLAAQILPTFHSDDRNLYFQARYKIEIVAGHYTDAERTLAELRTVDAASPSFRGQAFDIQALIYAEARSRSASSPQAFESAYRRAFRKWIDALDARSAVWVINDIDFTDASVAPTWSNDLKMMAGKTSLSLDTAASVVGDYYALEMARLTDTLGPALAAEDDADRYDVQKDVEVRTPDGGTICALVVRPRTARRLPTLLQFTIYADPAQLRREGRRSAANDYVGIVGLTRGKGCSPDAPIPYEHDGADADVLIGWIAAQPWSDGQVGMYGGSYSGFTPWAAVKHVPKALKAIMVGAPNGPGIDTPPEGGVFWNFIYPWTFYTLDNKTVDDATYGENARWRRLDLAYYTSGRAYRDLDKIDGTPNPVWDRWLTHPTYDSFWQSLIPYRTEFAGIDIPVLQTAGYYFGGPGAAVYYFQQHYKFNRNARHYLLIGPYDHFGAQSGPRSNFVGGDRIDPAAKIDLTDLRFQWFDHVLKGGPMPALLADKVNYEVAGANLWKHVPSLAAMADGRMHLYLSGGIGTRYRLTHDAGRRQSFVPLIVDLSDRSDAAHPSDGGGIRNKALDTDNGIAFVSDPLPAVREMSGLFSGQLSLVTNKKDFDFEIDLYELTSEGDYIQLDQYWSRASLVGDPTRRRLLAPGRHVRLNFQGNRLMSRRLAAGSRIVAVIAVIKEPGRQINYGTGKDVSDETIGDAGAPLSIRWFADSFIDLPIAGAGKP